MSKRQRITSISLIIGGVLPLFTFGGLVQVGNTTPQTSASSAASSCSQTFSHAFYEGQFFRAYDTLIPQTIGSSREILDATTINIYNSSNVLGDSSNGNSLGGLLPTFTYKSNGRPGTTHFNFGGVASVVACKQDNLTYVVKPSPNPSRTSIAAQINHNLYRRQIQSWGSTTNIYTMTYVDLNGGAGSFTANPSAWYSTQSNNECQNFYIAKCGDGVRDNPNKPGGSTTDGKDGIIIGGQLLPRSSTTNLPNEDCDGTDGVPSGYVCTPDCKLVAQPKCNLLPATQTILSGQSATLNYVSSNTISISNLIHITAGTIIPNTSNSFSVHPTVNTIYSFTANGVAGTTPQTCTATVNVQPIQQPACTLGPSQSIMACQNATLNFNSTNTTSITNLVNILAGIINPNQGGFFVVTPTVTTTYSFKVNGMVGSTPQSCTAIITVQPWPQPACTLGPSQTINSGQNATLNFNSTNTNSITNLVNITGGIINVNQAGFFVVSPTHTTSYSFKVNGGCNTTPQTCTAVITLNNPQPILTIHKTLINNILYQSGDLVGWRIDFSNIGSGTAHNVIINDYLPVSLGYISSHLYGIPPGYHFGTGMFGPNISIQYSGFDLTPGQTGYMLITGQLLDYALCNQTINYGYIQSDETPQIMSDDLFNCSTPDTNLVITKTVNSPIFNTGDHPNFTITVKNNGPYVASNVRIGDIRPANPANCLSTDSTYTSTVPVTLTNATSPYERTLNSTLPVGQTATLYIGGLIANGISCISNNYLNVATLKYVVNGVTRTGQAQAGFGVPGVIYQCKKLTALDGNIVLAPLNTNNNRYEGHAAFSCESSGGVIASTIVIDCGNGEIHTGTNTATFAATCHYSESSVPANRTANCYVNNTTIPACQQPMVIDEGFGGICGDGVIGQREKCDLGTNDAPIGNYLDSQHNVHAGIYANDGYICHDCDIEKGNTGAPMAACFSINNNSISLQENEILPFRRVVDNQNGLTSSCGNPNSAGKIIKNTLMCEFRLFNGTHPESAGVSSSYALTVNGNKTITLPCNTDQWTNSLGTILPIFDYFYSQPNVRSLQNRFGRYYITMKGNILDDGGQDNEKTYGEYNLALYKVSYDYCDANGNQQAGTPIDRVCEVDFTVTKPYLAQKSSFGLTPKSTTINLDGYKDIFGNSIISDTDLSQIMVLNESAYAGGSSIKTLMSSFINKYEKLAIKTNISVPGNTSVSFYKVPSQNIIVLKGNGTITVDENNDLGGFTDPFTLILDGVNVIIKGDLKQTNAMFLVKGGTIQFEEPDAPPQYCGATQTVQGIFVTDKSFVAGSSLANDNVNKTRCPFGGLYVKGVLIGSGIENLVQSRRSQLNTWFISAGSDLASIKATRRNEIFNGAAVLIEYSPSLRSNLPPGASEFTKALNVYKQ